ncbi:MAG TPA: FAD-linked oxidase C-terminal domain-containing protein [Gemmatimonadales bacterium]|nr:FAD-linked oxidase C-terminal domain-containing protein [Gemmatimonadales bacterium]
MARQMTSGRRPGDRRLAARLRRETSAEVLFDAFDRGRYSTDASFYQIEPAGVVVPRTREDVAAVVAIAREEGLSITPRGAGTSQCGQAIGPGLIVDTSKHLTRVLAIDVPNRCATVEPGVVLDRLNATLRPHGLHFPVDPATSSQATIGGMAGNNSAGARSIRYGLMADNVRAIEAILADGSSYQFGAGSERLTADNGVSPGYVELVRALRLLYLREADELERRVPKVLRHVAGYNLHRIGPPDFNVARLLVGSEGTLAFFTAIALDLTPPPRHTTLGVCHFPTLHAAMAATRHVVELGPAAVELVDRTLLGLARENPGFRDAVRRFVRGEPDALLLVEFAGDDREALARALDRLAELMDSLGLPNAVVRAEEPAFQREIWAVRKEGLNIVMSMTGDVKPVSFIEDCAVPLEHLADYTDGLSELFHRHGTSGTWYAHASVGCLHIRPALNLKDLQDVAKMRAIAEEAHALVRAFKGSHSGEHGDGLVRSEFIRPMLGDRLTRAFEEVKRRFDPDGLFNPGKITNPPRMDDRSLFRYRPEYRAIPLATALDWSRWGGVTGAVEMCNNNGACRKANPGVMCPSYRVTSDERDTTRGRANTLRLALTGQLGPGALTSREMHETLDLCVSCKACRRECPTGVDMARLKIEVLHQYHRRHGFSLSQQLVAYLPRYARWVRPLAPLVNLRNRSPALARWTERLLGIAARRTLPAWRRDAFRPRTTALAAEECALRDVVLWVDTFNTYFEPENARAALSLLRQAGYRVLFPRASDGARPLCCGRTFLAAGMVEQARTEARRVIDTLRPYVERGVPVIGLEPSCLLTVRDEYETLLPRAEVAALAAAARLLEEFLAGELASNRLTLAPGPLPVRRLLLHGHCHQKAFGVMPAVEQVLRLIPGVTVETIDSSCCGMAGAFGYEAGHYDVSVRMAELGLLPAIRGAGDDTWIVADGTSCRHQIRELTSKAAMHVAVVLAEALRSRR